MKELLHLTALDTERIEGLLAKYRVKLSDVKVLADAVRCLSDYYLERPDGVTPWQQEWAVLAYACYYLPLNYLRARGVVQMAQEVDFFAGLRHYTDFGSGLGSVSLALEAALPGHFQGGHAIERSATAIGLHQQLQRGAATPLTWSQQAPERGALAGAQRLTTCSYALTELPAIPKWALDGEALMLIEPATNQDSRRLLAWRQQLLEAGWHVWAPCTHAAPCPLLTESKRDWCHDRIHWTAPEWFLAIEEHLPMRNRSLTYSYLLLRRTAPERRPALARLTGDCKKEKGASRQMICRGPKREFLSWQLRHGEPPQWPRGELVELADDIPIKSNELRPTQDQARLAFPGQGPALAQDASTVDLPDEPR